MQRLIGACCCLLALSLATTAAGLSDEKAIEETKKSGAVNADVATNLRNVRAADPKNGDRKKEIKSKEIKKEKKETNNPKKKRKERLQRRKKEREGKKNNPKKSSKKKKGRSKERQQTGKKSLK